jgi:hypothetical protein
MTQPVTILPRNIGGRPPTHDWHGIKPEIETLIDAGYGLLRLSKHYKVSVSGMRCILRRLNLRTQYQGPPREQS